MQRIRKALIAGEGPCERRFFAVMEGEKAFRSGER